MPKCGSHFPGVGFYPCCRIILTQSILYIARYVPKIKNKIIEYHDALRSASLIFTKLNIASLHFLLNKKFYFLYVWKRIRMEILSQTFPGNYLGIIQI
jgi:hypothetical protein